MEAVILQESAIVVSNAKRQTLMTMVVWEQKVRDRPWKQSHQLWGMVINLTYSEQIKNSDLNLRLLERIPEKLWRRRDSTGKF